MLTTKRLENMKKIAVISQIVFALAIYCKPVNAQLRIRDSINISGAVLDADSLLALPGVNIYTQKNTGTISANNGFFTLQCNCNDTITFSYLGYKPFKYIIPDTLTINHYILGVVLRTDTILLSEVVILPWMNHTQFKDAFINHPVDRQTRQATQNLKIMNYTARTSPQPYYSGSMADYQLRQYSQDVEYRGMISPNDQLNVVGLATMLFFYAHQSMTQAERKQKLDEELRQYLQQNHNMGKK